MRKYIALLAALLSVLAAGSCRKDEPVQPIDGPAEREPQGNDQTAGKYVNIFTFNMINSYYLWNEEAAPALNTWGPADDPYKKLEEARYKDSSGNAIDLWSQLTDDFKTFSSSVAGTSRTYGFDFTLYYYDPARTTVCAVVTLVYPDSPAAKAGLGRGDCIVKIGGKQMTVSNYSDVINGMYDASSCRFDFHGGASVTMSPVEMYEEPVLMYRTFDCPGKKVGYLLYNSFTQLSCLKLIEACRFFKQEGVTELILDLRYNGGGYAQTELALASMLAPESDVTAKNVFETQVYNKTLSKAMGGNETKFTTDFSMNYGGEKLSFSTADANIGLDRIYAIVTSATASASESIIGGLKPYMDIEIIGGKTHGKFCSGIIMSANEWYEDVKGQLEKGEYENGLKYADNWGIYIMIGRYADKDGKTISMPHGITPDFEASDIPEDGCPLGNPEESMLSAALSRAGFVSKAPAALHKAAPGGNRAPLPEAMQTRRHGYGMKIVQDQASTYIGGQRVILP